LKGGTVRGRRNGLTLGESVLMVELLADSRSSSPCAVGSLWLSGYEVRSSGQPELGSPRDAL